MKPKFHEEFYSFAKYYDIAFDFKDVPAECHFLKDIHHTFNECELSSFIEFGAGPALHCLEMAKTVGSVTAVDLSSEMTRYAREKAEQAKVPVHCECADMIHYVSERRYDMAALLMDSTSYLLTNDDVISHLQSVAEVLNPGGIYLLEMSHPKGVFAAATVTESEWEMSRDDITVKIRWRASTDIFDPITQITEVSVRLDYKDKGNCGFSEDRSPQRCFTATEIEALVRASGVFKIVAWYGAMNQEVPFDNSERAWRMVPVLKKI